MTTQPPDRSGFSTIPVGIRHPQQRSLDVTAVLTLWVVFLFGLSARQVVPGFGAIGSPALLLTMPALLWWLLERTRPSIQRPRPLDPVRVVLLLYGGYLLFSHVVAMTRPLTGLENSGATRSLIWMAAHVGLALLVLDGMHDRARLETLLRRVVWGGAFLGAVGLWQFLTGEALQFKFPGLVWNNDTGAVSGRSIFHRPSGTAMHPIEFGVVTAALLPLALHFMMDSRPGGQRQRLIVATLLLAVGVPISVSRSGVIAMVAGLTVMLVGWGWRRRANSLLIGIAAVPALWLLVPGLVGTIRSLFTWFDADPSVQTRIDRIPRIMQQFNERPWFGLGNGTWSIEDYFLIDSQVYVTLLETGLVGALITVVLLGVAVVCGLWVAHEPVARPNDPGLGRAMAAGIVAILVSLFTFDAFHYRILTGILFLFIGGCGALLRLAREADSRTVR